MDGLHNSVASVVFRVACASLAAVPGALWASDLGYNPILGALAAVGICLLAPLLERLTR